MWQEFPIKPIRSMRLLQLTGIWQQGGIMWLALRVNERSGFIPVINIDGILRTNNKEEKKLRNLCILKLNRNVVGKNDKLLFCKHFTLELIKQYSNEHSKCRNSSLLRRNWGFYTWLSDNNKVIYHLTPALPYTTYE